MAVQKVKDPISGKQLLLVKGVVEGAYLNPLKNIKTYKGQHGDWTPDKSMQIVVDGERISLGLTDKDGIRCKDVDGNYHDLVRGVEVTVIVEEGEEYQGKMQYTSKTSLVTINDVSGAVQQVATGNKGNNPPPRKNNNVGIIAGNLRNVAVNQANANEVGLDPDELKATMEQASEVILSVQEWFSEQYPEVDEYSVGASVGQAAIQASFIAGSKKDLESNMKWFLENLYKPSVEIAEGMVGGSKGEAPKASPKPPKAAKKASKTVKQEVVDELLEDDDGEGFPF